MSGILPQNHEPPQTERSRAACCRAGSSAGRRRVEEGAPRSNFARRTDRHIASGAEAPRRQRSYQKPLTPEVTPVRRTSTITAENVTRGRPTARFRTERPCVSRTADRSCRPDSRAVRRLGGVERKSETRAGTAVASESWADARSHRSRREGEYGPARQGLLPLIAQSGPLRDTVPARIEGRLRDVRARHKR